MVVTFQFNQSSLDRFSSPLLVTSSKSNVSLAGGVTSLSLAILIGLLATDAGSLEILSTSSCLSKLNKIQFESLLLVVKCNSDFSLCTAVPLRVFFF